MFKTLFSLCQKKTGLELKDWYFFKIMWATLLFFLLFGLHTAQEIFHSDTLAVSVFYFLLAGLFLVSQVPIFVIWFVKNPVEHLVKMIIIVLALGIIVYGVILVWNTNQYQLLVTGSFILYLMVILTFFEIHKMNRVAQLLVKLRTLLPEQTIKTHGKNHIIVNTKELVCGDIVFVKAGEVIPGDGEIIVGTTSIDESPFTGEFKPLLKTLGDAVVGGTINRDSDITVKITQNYNDILLEKIIATQQQTPHKDFPNYKKSFRWTLFLCGLGLVSAVLCYSYYYLYLFIPALVATKLSLAVFLSFAMTSLPVSVLISTNVFQYQALNKGMFIKCLPCLKFIQKLDILYLDKTGTLTQGDFVYSQHFLEQGTNQGRLLSAFFSLAQQSSHPLAIAMESHPWYYELKKHEVADKKEYKGLGICGYIKPKGEKTYFAAIGNLRFLKRMQMQISRDMKNKIDDLESMGETVLLCGFDRQVKGILCFADTLRPYVRRILKDIQKAEIEPAIITGDSEESLAHITSELQIKKVYSRYTPEEKANRLEKDTKDGFIVGFVGARGNTMPFEKAHIKMTVATGTTIGDHPANMIIMGSDVRLIPWLLTETKKLFRKIHIRHSVLTLMALSLGFASSLGLTTPEFVMTIVFMLNLLILRSSTLGVFKKQNN